MIEAAWQQDTLKRYGKWWFEFIGFLERAGLHFASSTEQLANLVLEFAAGIAAQRRFNPAIQAIASVACVIKIELGQNLWKDARISAFVKGLRKLANIIKEPMPRRDPLPVEAIIHFVCQPPPNISPWKAALVSAVLAVGLRCVRRAKELCDLQEHHLEDLGSGRARIRMVFSKTDPAGLRGHEVPFEAGSSAADPIRCLDRYLHIAKGRGLGGWHGTRGVPLFIDEDGSALTSKRVGQFVKEVASHAGLSGLFTCYSVRIGGACSAIAGGISLEQLMAIGGWRSSSSVAAYARAMIGVQQHTTARMGL